MRFSHIRNKTLIILVFLLFAFAGNALAAGDSLQVRVLDGDHAQTYYAQEGQTVAQLIEDLDLDLNSRDSVSPAPETALADGTTITISRAIPVTVYVDGVPRMIYTQEKTAGALVESLSETLGSNLTLEGTESDTALKSDMSLTAVTMETHTITSTEAIPYETQIVETNELDKGVEEIAQAGVEGQKKIVTVQTVRGGQIVSEISTETVVEEAVPAIIRKGTRENVVQTGSSTAEYSYALNVKATAYTPYDAGCTGVTATGTVAGYGTLAVDPRVIPYGSRVYIPGYGIAIAEDTGGAIKGNRIDVCFESKAECFQWGVQNLTIYILK